MAWTSWSRTWTTRKTTTTSRKPLKCSSKILRWTRMYLLLRADQWPKQNHEDVLLPAHLQEQNLSVKDLGLILSQKLTYSPIAYPVTKQLSTLHRHGHLPREEDDAIEFYKLKDDLRNKFEHSQHWSDDMWKSKMAWRGGNKNFNIVLTRQDKKFFISELFKVIQDAISLILHYKTMCSFRTISSNTFITSDVQSVYTPSQIQDWSREDKIWARKDRQYSSRLWILWTRNTKICMRLT